MSPPLRLGGFTPLTTLDYPGKLACVLFCQGCAWRCRYCHNPDLLGACAAYGHDWASIRDFLGRRVGLLDAVVFSGGEATLQPGLGQAMREARALGFAVGLHSAGIHPARFRRALTDVDWVGFDIKGLPEDVAAVTGVRGSAEANWRSLDILLAGGVAYECRLTVHWSLTTPERLRALARRLHGMGVTNLAVQQVRERVMLDPALGFSVEPPQAEELWRELAALFPVFTRR